MGLLIELVLLNPFNINNNATNNKTLLSISKAIQKIFDYYGLRYAHDTASNVVIIIIW